MNRPWRSTVGVDVLLAGAVAGITVAAQFANLQGPDDHPLDPVGWLLAPALGGLLLLRRRYPVGILAVSSVVLIGYYALGYPPVGLALPLAGAMYSAAEAGRLVWAAAIALAVLVGSYAYRVAVGQSLGYLFGYELALTVVVWGGSIAAGDAIRSRRRARASAAEYAEMLLAEQQQRARQAIEAERRSLARDMHDTLAHTVAVISLHSEAAIDALPADPDAALGALRLVKAASRDAVRELRASLGLLRGETDRDGERHPVGTLRDLAVLAARARESGLAVTVEAPPPASLPSSVDSTAYRVIQESLTNVIRHAQATAAHVRVCLRPDHLALTVEDNGCATGDVAFGHGLSGMSERTALLGGALTAESVSPHGFRVRATLPVDPGGRQEAPRGR